MFDCNVFASSLNKPSNGHRCGSEYESNANSLEVTNSCWNPGNFTSERNENTLIKGDKEEHEKQGNDGDGGARNFESQELGIHGYTLLNGECLKLSHAGGHEDGAEYNWEHSN